MQKKQRQHGVSLRNAFAFFFFFFCKSKGFAFPFRGISRACNPVRHIDRTSCRWKYRREEILAFKEEGRAGVSNGVALGVLDKDLRKRRNIVCWSSWRSRRRTVRRSTAIRGGKRRGWRVTRKVRQRGWLEDAEVSLCPSKTCSLPRQLFLCLLFSFFLFLSPPSPL